MVGALTITSTRSDRVCTKITCLVGNVASVWIDICWWLVKKWVVGRTTTGVAFLVVVVVWRNRLEMHRILPARRDDWDRGDKHSLESFI